MQNFFLYLDDILGKGLPWYVIAQFLIYSSATIVPIVIPLAILLGSIMTFGTLAENFELTAMKSSGLSLIKIMQPMFFIVLLTAGVEFFFLNNVWPVSNLNLRTLIWDITKKKPTLNITNNVFYNGMVGVSIRVDKNDPETNHLEGVLLYFNSEKEPGNNKVIRAKSGSMVQSEDNRAMILTLYDGYEYLDSQDKRKPRKVDNTYEFLRSDFDTLLIRIDLSSLDFNKTDEELFSQYYEMLNMKQLSFMEDSLKLTYVKRVNDYGVYLNKNIFLLKKIGNSKDDNKDTLVFKTGIQKSLSKTIYAKDPIPEESFYAFMDTTDRTKIIKIAKNLTRNTRNYLNRSEEEFKSRRNYINRYRIEWHRKIMLSFVCIVLFFIGAPLGAIIRKGGFGFPVVFSIIFFLIFHIVTTSGEKMVKQNVTPAFFGMWLGVIVLIPFSLFLTYKAINDSSILEKDFYKQFLNPIVRLFRRKKNTDESTSTES